MFGQFIQPSGIIYINIVRKQNSFFLENLSWCCRSSAFSVMMINDHTIIYNNLFYCPAAAAISHRVFLFVVSMMEIARVHQQATWWDNKC